MQELLETAAALAQDQHAAGRALPRPLDLALFMTEFEREVAAPYLPRTLVRMVMRAIARTGRLAAARQAPGPARQAPGPARQAGTARVHN
jgi:hypothetical protein